MGSDRMTRPQFLRARRPIAVVSRGCLSLEVPFPILTARSRSDHPLWERLFGQIPARPGLPKTDFPPPVGEHPRPTRGPVGRAALPPPWLLMVDYNLLSELPDFDSD